MSTELEQRLRAALEARAGLVTPEALAGGSWDTDGRQRPWWRSESGMLFIAAVCVIVLAIPVLAMGLSGEPSRQGAGPSDGPATGADVSGVEPTGATDEPTSASSPLTGDVDGDGEEDLVRVVSGGDLPDGVTEVRAELTQRGIQSWTAGPGQDVELARLADVNDAPGAEVFVDVGSGPAGLVVLTAGESQLATIHRSDVALGRDEAGLVHGWWVSRSRLRTSVSIEEVAVGAESYAVEAIEWRPGAEVLVAAPLGRWCVRASEPERLLRCEESASVPAAPSASATESSTAPESSATETSAAGPTYPPGWWKRPHDGFSFPTQYEVTEPPTQDSVGTDGDADGVLGSMTLQPTSDGWSLVVSEEGRTVSRRITGGRPALGPALWDAGAGVPIALVRTDAADGSSADTTWQAWRYRMGRLDQVAVPHPSLGSHYEPEAGALHRLTWWNRVSDWFDLLTMEFLDEGTPLEDRAFPGWREGLVIHRVRVHSWTNTAGQLVSHDLGEACVVPRVGVAFYGCPPD